MAHYRPWCHDAILARLLQRGVKARQAVMLIIIEHAEEAKVLMVKGTSEGEGIDRAVDDKHRGFCRKFSFELICSMISPYDQR
jgi:hypothetical protein